MQAITKPLVAFDEPTEQRVIALLAQLSDFLPDWRAGKELKAERVARQSERVPLDRHAKELTAEMRDVAAQIADLKKRKDMVIAFVIAALTFVLIVPVWWAWNKFRVEKQRLLELQRDRERQFATTSDELAQLDARLSEIEREIAARPLSFPKVTLANVGFPIVCKQILGHNCLLDAAEAFGQTTLATVDLNEVGTGLEPIAEAVGNLANVPILLAPTSTCPDDEPLQKLYGEEDEFQKLVASFTEILGRVADVQLALPLIPARSAVAREISSGVTHDVGAASMIGVEGAEINQTSIDTFVTRVNDLCQNGQRTLVSLNRTFEALSSIGQLYARARSGSINHLHQQLFDVLNRSSWCSKRFYCPRSIQSPNYVYDTLGISFEEAHRLPLGELVAKMRVDPIIAARLAETPDFIEQLRIAHQSVEEFSPELTVDDQGNEQPPAPRAIYLEDQLSEALKQFRMALTSALFGTARPILAFSEESRVYYDPDVEEWKSDLAPHVYNTAQVQRYGQILKVRNDLLFPMWEHLWTEKADFRKSELFRTNESLIRMSEKESEKLIEIGNQFRADMRTIRENVYLLEPDLVAQVGELKEFKEGMAALGLLSERQQKLFENEKLGGLALPEGSLIEEANSHESWLGMEPKNQALRRGTAVDPIDDARSPAVLISYTGQRAPRLVLSDGAA